MATLVEFTEGKRTIELDGFLRPPHEFIRLRSGQEADVVENLGEAAWDRLESYISPRYIARPIEAIIRTEKSPEIVVMPVSPIAITLAEKYDETTGSFTTDGFVSGPTSSSLILPSCGTWRLIGTAGPATPEQPPDKVRQAWLRLISYYFENRGEVGDDFAINGYFRGCGAADLVRDLRRV